MRSFSLRKFPDCKDLAVSSLPAVSVLGPGRYRASAAVTPLVLSTPTSTTYSLAAPDHLLYMEYLVACHNYFWTEFWIILFLNLFLYVSYLPMISTG